MDDDRKRLTVWQQDKLRVDAELSDSGDLVIRGQDLSGTLWSEYEYALTVKALDVDKVISALGGAPDADVLALLAANAESIVKTGEKAWLERNSVPAEFWSRIDP